MGSGSPPIAGLGPVLKRTRVQVSLRQGGASGAKMPNTADAAIGIGVPPPRVALSAGCAREGSLSGTRKSEANSNPAMSAGGRAAERPISITLRFRLKTETAPAVVGDPAALFRL